MLTFTNYADAFLKTSIYFCSYFMYAGNLFILPPYVYIKCNIFVTSYFFLLRGHLTKKTIALKEITDQTD